MALGVALDTLTRLITCEAVGVGKVNEVALMAGV